MTFSLRYFIKFIVTLMCAVVENLCSLDSFQHFVHVANPSNGISFYFACAGLNSG